MSRRWIERQRYLIDYTMASMRRRKGRNLALLLVYAALIFLIASLMLFSNALKRQAVQLLAGAPEIVIQKMVAGRHDPILGTLQLRGGDHLHRPGDLPRVLNRLDASA